MPAPPDDQRPPLVVAIQWVSQITTVSLEMVLPAGLGYWLDGKFGTEPWLLIVGALIGFPTGMIHLLQMANRNQRGTRHEGRRSRDSSRRP